MTEHVGATIDLAPAYLIELRNAKELLESPQFAVQVINFLVVPIEHGIGALRRGAMLPA